MGLLKYKGYTGSVDYSEEDNCLYGKVLGMSKDAITYEGLDINGLRRDFEEAIDDYLALCKAQPQLELSKYLSVFFRSNNLYHDGVMKHCVRPKESIS